MIENYNSLFALTQSVAILGILIYLYYKQICEVQRPKDRLTILRWRIFFGVLIAIITFIPPTTYQYLRTIGVESEFLRNISSISFRWSYFALAILLLVVSKYKEKE